MSNIIKMGKFKLDETKEWDMKVKKPIIDALLELNIVLADVDDLLATNDDKTCSIAKDSFLGKQILDVSRFVGAIKSAALQESECPKRGGVKKSPSDINSICDKLLKELRGQSIYLGDRFYCVTNERCEKIFKDSNKYWNEVIYKRIESRILELEKEEKAVLYNNIDTFLKFCTPINSSEGLEVNVYAYYFDFLYLCNLVATRCKEKIEEHFGNISFNSSVFLGNPNEHEMIFKHSRNVISYLERIDSEDGVLDDEIDNVALLKKIKKALSSSKDEQGRSVVVYRNNSFAEKAHIITKFYDWEWKMLSCFSLIGMTDDRHKKFLEVIDFIEELVDIEEPDRYFEKEKEKAKSIINGLRILTDFLYKNKDRKQHIERFRASLYVNLEHYEVKPLFFY